MTAKRPPVPPTARPRDLNRLLQPKSIAVIGGGAWCKQVILQSERMGFDGAVWPVHPTAETIAGHRAFPSVDRLPKAPDAVFIGVNRHLTIDLTAQLSAMGAGGAVCFAAGFSEATAEDSTGGDLQAQLIAAAGAMPILGPNCYGFINALDGALLWPDQHGCTPVERGVAILTQSSNIAINLTMQQRGLPIAYTVTCGNMAQTSQSEVATALLDDPRVTAIGLHIEGFGDLRGWETLAAKAWAKQIPLIALKVGASDQAQQATISHTASLAGSDAGAQALLERLGIPRLSGLPDFLEALKLLHVQGPLPSSNIASISCSGGEASLIADMALQHALNFPPLAPDQETQLRAALGPMVALSNPLDYHTYIWRDEAAMTAAWSGMTHAQIGMTLSVVDYPTTDATDWQCATQAALNVQAQTGAPFGVVASLPELMPPDVARTLIAGGVVPFCGLGEALSAIKAAASLRPPCDLPLCLPGTQPPVTLLSEAVAKAELAAFGVSVPQNCVVRITSDTTRDITKVLQDMTGPFAVKGLGLAHKSDHNAVHLNIAAADVAAVAAQIGTDAVLIEEMAEGSIVEMLIGVTRDPAHGYVLTLGAGGVLTELLRDTASLLLPASRADIDAALCTLKFAPVLAGYRGKPAVARAALLDTIEAVQAYVLHHADTLGELEINPLICTPDRVVAVDALIRKG